MGLFGVAPQKASEERLILAVEKRDVSAARSALMAGASVDARNKYGVPALIIAAKNGDVSMVRALLSNAADTHASTPAGATALTLAVGRGHAEVARMVLEKGALPDAREDSGFISILKAAEAGDVGMIEMLAGAGANLNVRTQEGDTPLMMACKGKQWHAAQTLIGLGADVGTMNSDGFSAAHHAAAAGAADIIGALAKAGAALDETTTNGSTPLIVASRNGRANAVVALVRLGADVFAVDNHGKDAKGYALDAGSKDMWRFLEDAEQDSSLKGMARVAAHCNAAGGSDAGVGFLDLEDDAGLSDEGGVGTSECGDLRVERLFLGRKGTLAFQAVREGTGDVSTHSTAGLSGDAEMVLDCAQVGDLLKVSFLPDGRIISVSNETLLAMAPVIAGMEGCDGVASDERPLLSVKRQGM